VFSRGAGARRPARAGGVPRQPAARRHPRPAGCEVLVWARGGGEAAGRARRWCSRHAHRRPCVPPPAADSPRHPALSGLWSYCPPGLVCALLLRWTLSSPRLLVGVAWRGVRASGQRRAEVVEGGGGGRNPRLVATSLAIKAAHTHTCALGLMGHRGSSGDGGAGERAARPSGRGKTSPVQSRLCLDLT